MKQYNGKCRIKSGFEITKYAPYTNFADVVLVLSIVMWRKFTAVYFNLKQETPIFDRLRSNIISSDIQLESYDIVHLHFLPL